MTSKLTSISILPHFDSYNCLSPARWMSLELIFHLTLGKKLRPWLPQIFPPLPMELIMEEATPYSEVLKQSQRWINRVRKSMAN